MKIKLNIQNETHVAQVSFETFIFLYVGICLQLSVCVCVGACMCVFLGLNPKPSNVKQRWGSLPEISLCGKTSGSTKASSFSRLARPTAAQPLSHWEAHVIERRH